MKDTFTKKWIIEKSIEITSRYQNGILTLRGLHYQLVSIGMTNSLRHYKRVVNAMIEARWDGIIGFEKFSDHDREVLGETKAETTDVNTEIESSFNSIEYWMTNYQKNKWENQPYYPEVFIEKKALQGVFESVCKSNRVALSACKGYPSLTFLYDAAKRFSYQEEQGKRPIILYFGDYDPSGEDIPRSIEENIKRLGCESIEVRRFALMTEQVLEWKLPPAPVKDGDTRSLNWDGLGQVELDAIEPRKLQKLCKNAIDSIFDQTLYSELLKTEEKEKKVYVKNLKKRVSEL